MADVNPEWVDVAWQAWLEATGARHGVEDAVTAVEPLIRADERERTVPKCERCQRLWMRLDDAEAVAARLVEVICEQEARISAHARHIGLQAGRINEGWAVADNLRAKIAADIEASCKLRLHKTVNGKPAVCERCDRNACIALGEP